MVGRRARGVLGLDRGVLRASASSVAATARAGRDDDAGGEWFPGARLSYAEHIFARQGSRRASRSQHALRAARARRLDAGRELRERDGRDRRRAARLGRRRRRPRGRLHAEHPRDGRGVPRLRVDRRDLVIGAPEFGARSVVDRFAQIEPKVLLAIDGYRYGGQATSTAARSSSEIAAALPVARARRDASATSTGAAGSRASSALRPPLSSSSCRSTIRSGCSTAPARPACRSRSSTARAGSCSSS